MAIEKIKILGALLEIPATQHSRIGQVGQLGRGLKEMSGMSMEV